MFGLFDLTILGWKAFQDLCVAIASEVLQRPVHTFLPSRDGGRDGAFIGVWAGGLEPGAKSTIQCKFTSRPGAVLTLAQLKPELAKVSRLADRGLAHDYIIMSNAGVSGEADAEICAAVVAAGAQACQVFDGGWIVNQLRERPRLRMMAPRVYGIGDLSQILDDRAYTQARYMLSSLGDDLKCFVPTLAHQQAVAAMKHHGFVLLLGEPAAGKSTIAATLALGALDDGCVGALRISRPDQLGRWNPYEKQFLWVDDAFGATQFDAQRVQGWNQELPLLSAAVRAGSKIVFTSRNYIWSAAHRQLKSDQFRPLRDSQVVINVQGLTQTERAQILYNHVKHGDQPAKVTARLKPFLPDIASNPAFLPETARRLGDPLFTRELTIDHKGLKAFVEKPVDFLKAVLSALDAPSQAAIALIFLSRNGAVASPLEEDEDLGLICRLMGVTAAAVGQAMEHLRDSLTLLVDHPEGPRWTLRHPTISDAFAAIVAESPERVALYVRGAHTSRILVEATCGMPTNTGAFVRVPSGLYGEVVQRIAGDNFHRGLVHFLSRRCDAAFLKLYAAARPDVLRLGRQIGINMAFDADIALLHRMLEEGILPEAGRHLAVEQIREITMSFFDSSFLVDEQVQGLLGEEEFARLEQDYREHWINRPDHILTRWREDAVDTDDVRYHISELVESVDRAQTYYRGDPSLADTFMRLRCKIDEWRDELGDEPPPTPAQEPRSTAPVAIKAIFEDIDI